MRGGLISRLRDSFESISSSSEESGLSSPWSAPAAKSDFFTSQIKDEELSLLKQ